MALAPGGGYFRPLRPAEQKDPRLVSAGSKSRTPGAWGAEVGA